MVSIKQKMIDRNFIIKHLETGIDHAVSFATLGLVNSQKENTLTFLDSEAFLQEVANNTCVSGVLINATLASKLQKLRSDIQCIISEEPRYDFFYLHNRIAELNLKHNKYDSIVDDSAIVHKSAYVSEHNVKIGKNTIIQPNVTILRDVEIGENCIIQAGSVLGSEGFEYKYTSKGILPVIHDGKIFIGNDVHIGANTCIDKGFSYKHTRIEDEVKIDNLIHVAHSVHIKKGAFIIAGTVLGGSTTIEESTWLSINTSIAPGITVKKNGFVSIGAVVTRDVDEDQQVTGNFAIPHKSFLKLLKKNLKEIKEI